MMMRSLKRKPFAPVAVPTLAYLGGSQLVLAASGATAAGNYSTIAFPATSYAYADRLIVGAVCSIGTAGALLQATICGESGFILGTVAASRSIHLISALVPNNNRTAGANQSNVFPVSLRFAATLSTEIPTILLWELKGLAKNEPRDVQTSTTAVDTVRAVDLNTTAGGIIVAFALNDTATTTCTWTGDQTPTEHYDAGHASDTVSAASISATNNDAANTITSTFALSSGSYISLLAASFR